MWPDQAIKREPLFGNVGVSSSRDAWASAREEATMSSSRTKSYVRRFGLLIKLGRIRAGSPEERFARHRYRFAGLKFDLAKHNGAVGYNEWKRQQYTDARERNADQEPS